MHLAQLSPIDADVRLGSGTYNSKWQNAISNGTPIGPVEGSG
jgi:hypothetical protein